MDDTSDDRWLIKEYAAGSQRAFTELAHRHAGLVYSAALRQTCDPQLAQDVTQAVFLLLARKAAGLGPPTVISAWLYRTARFAARDAMKKERRRQFYEAKAAIAATASIDQTEADSLWAELSPHLDDAMSQLRDRDQTAILLRFFENKSLSDVGAILGISQAAAGQRIARAVERMRKFFARRGMTAPATGLIAAIACHAVIPAPPAAAAAASATSTPSPISLTIAKGASTMMLYTQIKFLAVALVLALPIALCPVLLEMQARGDSKAAPAPTTHYVRVVVDVNSVSFQGKPTTLAKLPALLEAVDDRVHTVLQMAYATDEVTMGWFMRVESEIYNDDERKKLGFKYLDHIGRRPVDSVGTDLHPAAMQRPIPLPSLPQAPVSQLTHNVPFQIGQTQFQGGDSITITEVRGTSDTIQVGDTYQVKGTYHLASHDQATLALSVTAIRREDAYGDWAANQSTTVHRGDGEFTLYERIPCPGYPHVSFYADGECAGGVYFGTGDSILKK